MEEESRENSPAVDPDPRGSSDMQPPADSNQDPPGAAVSQSPNSASPSPELVELFKRVREAVESLHEEEASQAVEPPPLRANYVERRRLEEDEDSVTFGTEESVEVDFAWDSRTSSFRLRPKVPKKLDLNQILRQGDETKQSAMIEARGRWEYFDLRKNWSWFLTGVLALHIILQWVLLFQVGSGKSHFEQYGNLLQIVVGTSFVEVVGLCLVVVKGLFPQEPTSPSNGDPPSKPKGE